MEPSIREFLRRILVSVSLFIIWMLFASTFGIMFNYAFIDEQVTLGNIIFYIWLVGSFAFVLWRIIKMCRTPLDFNKDHDLMQ